MDLPRLYQPENRAMELERQMPLMLPGSMEYLSGQTEHDSALWEYWNVLRKRKWVVISGLALVMAATILITFRQTPLYEGVSSVAVMPQNGDILGSKDTGGEDWDYNVTLDTQIRVLMSDGVAMNVIRTSGLDKNPVFTRGMPNASTPNPLGNSLGDERTRALLTRFREGLQVATVPRTRIVEIHYRSPDRVLAAEIANAVAREYINENFRAKFESTTQASDWLSKQLADLRLKVESSQEKLVAYQKQNDVLGIDERQNLVTTKLEQLNKDLTEAQSDRIRQEALYKLSRSNSPELLAKNDGTGVLEHLVEQRNELASKLTELNIRYGRSHPQVQAVDAQIAQVNKSIQTESNRIGQRFEQEYRAAAERERMLHKALEDQKEDANRLNEKNIEYNILKRDADSTRQLYDNLLAKLKEASVAAGLKSNNIRVVDVAQVPNKPVKPNVPQNLIVGLLVGLTLGVAMAFVTETLDNTVGTSEQAERMTGLPAVAVIPNMRLARAGRVKQALGDGNNHKLTSGPEGGRIALVSHVKPKSENAEAFRALRTSVLLSGAGAPPRVIVVTSALPQEGKTSISINTAIVLAQNGGRVLLVDADMRRPSVARHLGLRSETGLSTQLATTSSETAVQGWPDVPNLSVLPAGPPPVRPAELIGSERMRALLTKWRAEYDHVIIDTPPVLSVTDGVLLSTVSDCVLLVMRSGVTPKGALQRANQLLSSVSARVLGLVINDVDLNSVGHYSYYGSKYYGYYHEG